MQVGLLTLRAAKHTAQEDLQGDLEGYVSKFYFTIWARPKSLELILRCLCVAASGAI